RVNEERGPLGGCLAHADWIEIEDDTLRITFAAEHAFFRDQVESREASDYLKGVARAITGRPLGIQAGITPALARDARPTAPEPAGRSPVAPSAAEPPRAMASRAESLREQAMKEPAVRSLLDALGGEIVDVESI